MRPSKTFITILLTHVKNTPKDCFFGDSAHWV